MYPDSLARLIDDFKKLPGVGEKTAERMAFAVLALDDEKVIRFSNDLNDIKQKIKKCKICGSLTDNDLCFVCADKNRNEKVLCIVEDTKDVFLFEKTGNFDGRYHVLGALISPIDGIGPEDLPLKEIIERVEKEKIEEIIVAVKGTVEGETTALYIKKILEGTPAKVTRIASGIPVGADMDYIDALTLESAFRNRKEL